MAGVVGCGDQCVESLEQAWALVPTPETASASDLLDGATFPIHKVQLHEPGASGFTLGTKGCAETGPTPVPTSEQTSQAASTVICLHAGFHSKVAEDRTRSDENTQLTQLGSFLGYVQTPS